MTELEQRIKEQVDYCFEYKYFRSVIWISSEDKMENVKDILMRFVDEISDDYMLRAFPSGNEFIVDFIENHSWLKIIKPSDYQRGIKMTGCIIDKDILDHEKYTLIYPKLTPRIIDMQNGVWEPSEKLQERVHEVEI